MFLQANIVSPSSLFDKRQSFFENFYKSNLPLTENAECQKLLTYIRHVDSAEAERLEDIATL